MILISAMERKFTRVELAYYNGLDGIPAYVAYHDKVYDVSQSYHWRKGKHQFAHFAGSDLTAAMGQAPHTPELLLKFPIVGELIEE
jgi:predicted heme/steroid binding protein